MDEMVKPLCEWFMKNKRDLPWRGTRDAYKIYISEIMLQQTRVEAVKPYYERFLKEIPDFKALSEVSDDVLFKLWEGLGYYSRAKNLKKCATVIMNEYDGTFPNTYLDALALPGIGMYTAGAILSRTYNLRVAAVDGNVLRVMERIFMDDDDILKDTTKKKYKDAIEKVLPDDPGMMNEAVMELGATICMPKIALCDECPLKKFCKAHKNDCVYSYPVKTKKTKKKNLEYSLLFITDGERYLLFPKKEGVLSGMNAPLLLDRYGTDAEIREYVLNTLGIESYDTELVGEKNHVFSHQVWYMRCYKVYAHDLKDYASYTEEDIRKKVGLPTAYRKFLDDLF